MKYLIKNTNTNVIELVYDMLVQISDPNLEIIEVPNTQFKERMLGSVFIDVDRYKEHPGWNKREPWWESDGTNWIDARDDTEMWEFVRTKRNEELLHSDWTQLDDSVLTPPNKGLWTAYRNVLRNVTNNNPNNPRAAVLALEQAINNKPVASRS